MDRHIVESGKASAARDGHAAIAIIFSRILLIDALHIEIAGARSAVGIDESVDAANGAIREIAEVAAIKIACIAVFVRDIDRMVAPLPDTAAEIVVVLLDKIPERIDITRAHRADIFAHIKRLRIFFIIEIVLYIFRAGVHTALDIRDIGKILALGDSLELEVGVFIVNKSTVVARADILRHRAVVDTRSRLVAERPEHDTAVVLVALKESLRPVNISLAPLGSGREMRPARPVPFALPVVAHAVGFDIGFVGQHYAVFITQRGEARIVGICDVRIILQLARFMSIISSIISSSVTA